MKLTLGSNYQWSPILYRFRHTCSLCIKLVFEVAEVIGLGGVGFLTDILRVKLFTRALPPQSICIVEPLLDPAYTRGFQIDCSICDGVRLPTRTAVGSIG